MTGKIEKLLMQMSALRCVMNNRGILTKNEILVMLYSTCFTTHESTCSCGCLISL
jgi:hypothetical protein